MKCDNITTAVRGMSPEQKQAILSMGFGSILQVNITSCPGQLSYYLLDVYDANSKRIVLQNSVIEITEQTVHDMMGLPTGGEDINELPLCDKGNQILDDENGIEDFNFPDNDTLYNGGFHIRESSNPYLEDANHEEDENQVVDEDTEDNCVFAMLKRDNLMLHMITFLLVAPLTMYRNYALESGFDVRLRRVKKRKQDYYKLTSCMQSGRRDCKEKFVIDIIPGTLKYVVSDFVEQHNHELFSKGNMYLSRSKRKLDYSQEIFIHNLSKQNIGPIKAHRLYSALHVGPSEKKFPSFTFEYKVLNKLNALFWADETAKYNYNSFGDVVSLDATFSMNKYDMVFVPFTDIDNHKKCVTFGVGLLSKEDGVSYEWLLRAFLKDFRKQPQLVISDQDPALEKAIDNVFPLAHHRLCMWHITKKLPNKSWNDKDIIKLSMILILPPLFLNSLPVVQMNLMLQRAEHLKKLLGMVVPDVVSNVSDIQNPSDIRKKGCGNRGKRLKSTKEMIKKESSKPKRKCATCEQMVHHDKRNCPLKNVQK
ncbi:unnamed protein product [Lactuca saligna]|uniref:MULE transposase domain-containing protein n=1 Tax=Lactuca saligna TaxID=75948 RepID=A0AA35ZW91_LACSI|nr:unnamed protein product [Lactuca saligna]